MLFAEPPPFEKLNFFGALELGLYSMVIGYYVFTFAYFIVIRYRTSKKIYWLLFALLSLFLAIARGFFIAYYFFIPELSVIGVDNYTIGLNLMTAYRVATFFTWMGITCIVGVLGILLLPTPVDRDRKIEAKNQIKAKLIELFNNDKVRYVIRTLLILLPFTLGILALVLPPYLFIDPEVNATYGMGYNLDAYLVGNYPIGRFVLNTLFLPLLIFMVPLIFIYLAWKTFGVLRKSYGLNAMAFIIYLAARLCQYAFESVGWSHMSATIPPLLIILSLLMIAIANNVEQLK